VVQDAVYFCQLVVVAVVPVELKAGSGQQAALEWQEGAIRSAERLQTCNAVLFNNMFRSERSVVRVLVL
jgi:hypothetical protein